MRSHENDTDLLLRALALAPEPEQRDALAERLDACGGLFGLFRGGLSPLEDVLDPEALCRLEALVALAESLVAPPTLPDVVADADAVAAYFRPRLIFLEVESLWVLMLDARGRPVGCARVADGTLTACLVHPREVFAPALRARAASIILVHNHPSGDPLPSVEDEILTERLMEAGVLLGVPLVDHVIVARGGFRSLGGGLREPESILPKEARTPRVASEPQGSSRPRGSDYMAEPRSIRQTRDPS